MPAVADAVPVAVLPVGLLLVLDPLVEAGGAVLETTRGVVVGTVDGPAPERSDCTS